MTNRHGKGATQFAIRAERAFAIMIGTKCPAAIVFSTEGAAAIVFSTEGAAGDRL